jgi:acetylornithine deacetylase/succinyl-diaminopimelate desuccinylase-like protein
MDRAFARVDAHKDDYRARPYGVPATGTGAGCAHSDAHAPNENIRADDCVAGLKHIAAILRVFGGGR